MPAVSILLPVRDEEALLPAALTSLRRQFMTDWELVAVDDGSRDDTGRILEAASQQDERIHVVRQPAQGLVAALNTGLEACSADLIARMDGDDVCHPERLGRQLAYLEAHPRIDLVACRVRHIPRPAIRGGLLAYEAWQNSLLEHDDILRNLFVESPFAHPSVMFRKKSVTGIGGYREMGWAEDYDLWLRMAQGGASFARVPQTLLYWRDRPQRLSRTGGHCTLAAFRACKAHFLCQTFLDGVTQVNLWGAGDEGKAWRLTLAEHGIEVSRWVEIAPDKVGQTIHNAPVIHRDDLSPDGTTTLVTIGAKGAREEVRDFARAKGLIEGQDFVCVT